MRALLSPPELLRSVKCMSLAGLEPATTRLEDGRSCPSELQARVREGDGESRTRALSFTGRPLCRLSYTAVLNWSGRAAGSQPRAPRSRAFTPPRGMSHAP